MSQRLRKFVHATILAFAGVVLGAAGLPGRQTVDFSPRGQTAPTSQNGKKPVLLAPESRIVTDHLSVVVGPSEATAAAGSRVSLTLDVKPRPGVHVYAPGNADYIPVALRVDPQPNLTLSPTTFPPAEDFYFKPLDEHVKVYEKPFRIVQDVMLDGSPAAQKALKASGTVTVSGSFDYQACDDRVCFAPKTVPITWTIRVKELAK